MGEVLGAWGHSKVLGGRPFVDFASGEFDPLLDGFEYLDLESRKQHREVCSLWEWVSAVEVRGHEFDDGLVVFANVALELIEGSEQVCSRSVIGEEQPQ